MGHHTDILALRLELLRINREIKSLKDLLAKEARAERKIMMHREILLLIQQAVMIQKIVVRQLL